MSILAIISIVLATLIWGWSFPATKSLLGEIHPLWINIITFGISGFIFWVIAILRKKRIDFRFKEGVLLGVLIALIEIPQVIGLSLTSSSNTVLITGLGILLAPLFESIYLRKTPKKRYLIALFLGFTGLYLVTGGINSVQIGDLIVLICSLFVGIYIFTAEHFEHKRNYSLVSLCTQQFLTVAAISALVAYFFKIPLDFTSVAKFGPDLVLLTLFPTLIAYFLEDYGQAKLTTITASFLLVLEPVFGVFFSIAMDEEIFSILKVIGTIILILSIGLSIYHKRKGLFSLAKLSTFRYRSLTAK